MYPNGSGHGGPQHRPDGHVRERAGQLRDDRGPAQRPEGQAAVAVAERGGERAAQEQDAQHEEVSAMLKNKMCMHGVFPDFAGEKKEKRTAGPAASFVDHDHDNDRDNQTRNSDQHISIHRSRSHFLSRQL